MIRVGGKNLIPVNIARKLFNVIGKATELDLDKTKIEVKNIVEELKDLIVANKEEVFKKIQFAQHKDKLNQIFTEVVLEAFENLGVLETSSHYIRPKDETQVKKYYFSPTLNTDQTLWVSSSHASYPSKETMLTILKDIPLLIQQAFELTQRLQENGIIHSNNTTDSM